MAIEKDVLDQVLAGRDPPEPTGDSIWVGGNPSPSDPPAGFAWTLSNNGGGVSIGAVSTGTPLPTLQAPVWKVGNRDAPIVSAGEGNYLILQDDGCLCYRPVPQGGLDPENAPDTTGVAGALSYSIDPTKIPIAGSVKGIRVHNTSGFVFRFMIQGISGSNPGYTSYFPLGQYESIDFSHYEQQGQEMSPVCQWSVSGFDENAHAAEHNCVFDARSNLYGVYNCSGVYGFPSFSYQGTSSDQS